MSINHKFDKYISSYCNAKNYFLIEKILLIYKHSININILLGHACINEDVEILKILINTGVYSYDKMVLLLNFMEKKNLLELL